MKIVLSLFSLVLLVPSCHADAVRLHIVGPDKKPVPGAKVMLAEFVGYENASRADLSNLTSDENGVLAFETKRPMKRLEGIDVFTKQNTLMVRVLAPGMAVALLQIQAGEREVALEAGRSWGGQVLDESQKPVAGVRVALTELTTGFSNGVANWPEAFQLESTTDKDGRWSLPNLPLTRVGRFEFDSPGSVREIWSFALDAAAAPPFFLEPGATIKGRFLKPDGTPAADVPLIPQEIDNTFSFQERFRTAADGTFKFTGLAPGDISLVKNSFVDDRLPFTVEALGVQGLKAGEVRDVGDWKAKSGVRLRGKIVGKGLKKPIPSARLASKWRDPEAYSDKNGGFNFVVREDATDDITVAAEDFMSVELQPKPIVNGIMDFGTIELQPGLSISGTIKDKNGKGVANIAINAFGASNKRQYAFSNGNGQFTIKSLAPGSYRVGVGSGKPVNGGNFTIIEGQKPAPLELQLDTEAGAKETRVLQAGMRETVEKIVRGRVVDRDGNPIGGAKVWMLVGPYQKLKVISDADGYFKTTAEADATIKVTGVKRPGFTFQRAAEFQLVDGARETNIVLQPQGSALRGKVIDAQGQPVPRAYVSIGGSNVQPIVQADENGAFSLPDAPVDEVTVLAASGRSYGETKIGKADGDVQVTLREAAGEPGTPAEAAALADELVTNAKLRFGADGLNTTWDILGTARVEKAIANDKSEWSRTQFLEVLAQREPETFLARQGELMGLMTKGNMEVEALVARVQARSDDPAQRAKAQTWLKEHDKPSLKIEAGSVSNLLYIASVAEAYQAGGSSRWIDYAAQIAAQLPEKDRLSSADAWGTVAAKAGPVALDNFIQEWSDNARLRAYRGAVQTFLQNNDLKNGAATLKLIEAAVPDAENEKEREQLGQYEPKPKDLLQWVRGDYAQKLALTDPVAAQEMVDEVADYHRSVLLLRAGRAAAKQGQKEIATKALREVFNTKLANVEWYPLAAAFALDFDPKLADELFQLAWERTRARLGETSFFRVSIDAYAGARAKNWPGESRILIEREWAQRLPEFKEDDQNNVYQNATNLKALVTAMAKISPRRAIEMAAQLPNYQELKGEAVGNIMVELLREK